MRYLDVWIGPIQENKTSNYFSLLAPEEKLRAEKYTSAQAKVSFVHGRGLLRILLGKRLLRPPQRIEIVYTKAFKPRISGGEVDFNISHSGDYLAIAMTNGGEVGIDLERHRPLDNLEGVADQVFNVQELALLNQCQKSMFLSCFYELWTQKEACLKAQGTGFLTDPKTVSIFSHNPLENKEIIYIKKLSLFEGYSAAVAMKQPLPPERFFLNAWPDE